MVRRRSDEKAGSANGNSRVKFRYADEERYLDIEAEGATETLTDGFKTLANALSRGSVPARALTIGKPPASAGATAAAVGAPTIEADELEQAPAVEDLEDDHDPDGSAEVDRPKKPRSAPPAPKFLSDLNLASAKVPLKEFIELKNPTSDIEKYTVVAVWFKENFNIEEVSSDHIFTAYKHLAWDAQLPTDVGKPLRNAKSLKSWFDKGAGKGTYKLNWNGESAVSKMGTAKSA